MVSIVPHPSQATIAVLVLVTLAAVVAVLEWTLVRPPPASDDQAAT